MAAEDDVLLAPFRAVYVGIPKVACTSLKVAFARLLGIRLDQAGGDPHAAAFPTPPPRTPLGRAYRAHFAFAFVRNPWDRLVSCYRDKIRGEVGGFTHCTVRPGVADCLARFECFTPAMPFDAFVRAVAAISDVDADAHFRSQHTFVTDERGDVSVDFVGRFERLGDDFERVRRAVGMPQVPLPRLQGARSAVRYAAFYTPETRDLVARRFRRDVETFGYRFDA